MVIIIGLVVYFIVVYLHQFIAGVTIF